MIIDCNIFYNEHELAEIRIHELKDVVDKFIFISSQRTFQGRRNPYKLPKHLYELADVEFRSFKPPHTLRTWDAEHWLRNRLGEVIKPFGPNDLIIMSDADEIISAETVAGLEAENNLKVDQYYYNFRNYMRKHHCPFSFKVKNYHPAGCEPMRYHGLYPVVPDAGWEFSFFGDVKFIQNKLKSYSHDELLVPEYYDADKIQHRLDNGIDIVDRPVEGEPSIALPEYVLNNKEKYARFW